MNNNDKFTYNYISTYNYEGKLRRVYDCYLHDSEFIFHNEVCFILKEFIEKNLKLFFINTTYNQQNDISSEDLNFFKKLWNSDPELPYNLKKLRDLQSKDLLYFYDNLICEMFCIFSEITDNKYHYNLLIAVKSDFDLDLIYKNKFNLIEIVSINQIYEENLNYNYMQSLFNFSKLREYSFYHYNEPDYRNFIENVDLCLKNTQEYLDYETFDEKSPNSYKLDENLFKKYLYLQNNKFGAFSEILDQRVYYSYIFKSFGWHMYVLNYEFSDFIYYLTPESKHHFKKNHTYDCNSSFFLKDTFSLSGNAVEDLPDFYKKGYTIECLWDTILMFNLGTYGDNFRYNISIDEISIPKIKYGKEYKQRLRFWS